MIKAEIISHEGNPGANWLDRCRTVITPTTISTLIVLITGAAFVTAVAVKRSNTAVKTSTSTSQPSVPTRPLTVQPLTSESYQSASDSASTVQSANGGTTAAPTQSSPLNNAASTPDTSQKAVYDQLTGLNNSNLTTNVQSTIQSIDSTLKKTAEIKDNLKNSLGL